MMDGTDQPSLKAVDPVTEGREILISSIKSLWSLLFIFAFLFSVSFYGNVVVMCDSGVMGTPDSGWVGPGVVGKGG